MLKLPGAVTVDSGYRLQMDRPVPDGCWFGRSCCPRWRRSRRARASRLCTAFLMLWDRFVTLYSLFAFSVEFETELLSGLISHTESL